METMETKTELIYKINNIKLEHDKLKQKIVDDTILMEEINVVINKNLLELDVMEKNYVDLVDKLYK